MSLTSAGKQPGGSDECGAYALQCVLQSLDGQRATSIQGVKRLDPANVPSGYTVAVGRGEKEELHDLFYQASGVLELELEEQRARYAYAGSGMNAPSALATIAAQAGYRVREVVISSACKATYKELSVSNSGCRNLYTTEKALLTRIGVAVREREGFDPPPDGSLSLVLVRDGEHWVAVSGEELYDPATGGVEEWSRVADHPTDLTTTTDMTYDCTGLRITVALPS